MKISKFWKSHKPFILSAMVVLFVFFLLLLDNHIRIYRIKQEDEAKLEELQKLVQVTNIGKSPEREWDIDQTAEDFLYYFYGVSEEVTADYRREQLKGLMTDAAYHKYVLSGYENSLDYTVTLTDIHIYADSRHSGREGVYVCIFYQENTDWPGINRITVKKYWKGVFIYDELSEKWRVEEITDCQELLTREEFDALAEDTDIEVGGNTVEKEESENADRENK